MEAIDMAGLEGELKELVGRILGEAKRQGATAAEVSVTDDAGLAVKVRNRELETVEFTHDRGFGITVFDGQRKGSASTSDASEDAVQGTVRAALNIARFTEEDPCNGLAEAELMARELPELDLYHPWPLDVPEAERFALETEAAAFDHDARITNSEGAEVASHRSCSVYGNSHDFVEALQGTRHSVSVSVIAEEGSRMQNDYWYTMGRVADALDDHKAVGRRAAERAVARLGVRPVATGQYPVLFDPQMASSLIGHLIGAISGGALYRKASWLLDSLGKQVMPSSMSLVENPHLPRGIASTPFDGDGVATRAKAFVENGVVASYVLGNYAAKRLDMVTTGNAGGVFNLEVQTERKPASNLMREVGTGLMVTHLMGQGVNRVTGDYSRGASGIWIENGEPAHAVDEVTIAANLADVYRNIVAAGDDVDRRGTIHVGSLLVDGMTVAAS
ncbi:MAG: metalloprotease PmbA [Gammaproteobacteria bacterium]|nr:metalloprotease PmbA [Gammaproteobacteria bacterium]MYB36764.1 metalloprotease PmbA [Gammaproteobacteria bacterium]